MFDTFLNGHCDERGRLMSDDDIADSIQHFKQWTYIDDKKILTRIFELENFQAIKNFLRGIIKIIDQEKHYPNITFGDKFVIVSLLTIDVEGVSQNDFIIAAKIEDFFLKNFVIN